MSKLIIVAATFILNLENYINKCDNTYLPSPVTEYLDPLSISCHRDIHVKHLDNLIINHTTFGHPASFSDRTDCRYIFFFKGTKTQQTFLMNKYK